MNKKLENNIDLVILATLVILSICVVLAARQNSQAEKFKIKPPAEQPKVILKTDSTPVPLKNILFKNNGVNKNDVKNFIHLNDLAVYVPIKPYFEKLQDVIYEFYELDWEPPVFDSAEFTNIIIETC